MRFLRVSFTRRVYSLGANNYFLEGGGGWGYGIKNVEKKRQNKLWLGVCIIEDLLLC